jgi:hypothetical protein
MKKYIYIVLFAILLLYVNNHSKCLNEKFTNDKKINNIKAPNPFNILKTNKVKPFLIEGNSELVPAYDRKSYDVYSDKYWIIKKNGFSDIYNYEDQNILKPKLDEAKVETNQVIQESTTIKQENNPVQEKISGPPKTYEYKKNIYNLIGTASNDYYSQYYYLYETLTKQDVELDIEENLKYIKYNQVYEYLLIKIRKNKVKISHYIGPRNKINMNDIVYFSLGNFQLGPLKIKPIN